MAYNQLIINKTSRLTLRTPLFIFVIGSYQFFSFGDFYDWAHLRLGNFQTFVQKFGKLRMKMLKNFLLTAALHFLTYCLVEFYLQYFTVLYCTVKYCTVHIYIFITLPLHRIMYYLNVY